MKFSEWTVLFVAATFLITSENTRAQLASFQEFSAVLTGTQQVPGVPTAASGSVRLNLRNYELGPFTPAFDLQASFTGLSGGWTMAGLYGPADSGQTGPLIADFTNNPLYPPPGATSGSFQIMDYWQVSRAQIDALLAGKVYFNLHSTAFPGGEIRGQLLKEPAAPTGGTMQTIPATPPTTSITIRTA